MNYKITDVVPYSDPHSRGTGSIVTQHIVAVCECLDHGTFEVRATLFPGHTIDHEPPGCSECRLDRNCKNNCWAISRRVVRITRTRGEHNRLVRHDYRCPVHGVFEAMVKSGYVPDNIPCQYVDIHEEPLIKCGVPSPWQYPIVGQGISAGIVKT